MNELLDLAPPAPLAAVDHEAQKTLGHVKALGTVQCFLGVGGLVTPLYIFAQRPRSGPDVVRRLDALLWSGDIGFWMYTTVGLGVVLASFLLVTGISMTRRRPRARVMTLVHGVAGLLNGLLNASVTFFVVVPALMAFAERNGPVGMAGAIGGIVGGVVGCITGIAFPTLELWAVSRPKISAMLRSQV
jgi:hypothetical protein